MTALCHRAVLDYIFTFFDVADRTLQDLTKEELDELTSLYSDAEISRSFGLSRTAATHARKKHGVLSYAQKKGERKYKDVYEVKPGAKRVFSYRKSGANENFFAEIDSPRKAYWLGLVAADGWIVREHNEPKGFAIALKEEDSYLLRQFAEDLGCPDLLRKERETNNLWQIKLTAKKAAVHLMKAGVPPRKSLIVEAPKLPRCLFIFWLRGYFDGNGSVSRRKNSLGAKITTGSKILVEQLNEFLNKELINSTISGADKEYNLRMYSKNAMQFAQLIYAEADEDVPCLLRKRDLFFGVEGQV